MATAFDGPDDLSRYFFRRHPVGISPRKVSVVLDQVVEMLGFGRPGGHHEHIDAQSSEFGPHCLAEAMQGEFAG
jgi:hypothetical protein